MAVPYNSTAIELQSLTLPCSYIIPDPAIVHGFCESHIQFEGHREQRWLAIKQTWIVDHRARSLWQPGGVRDVEREETVALLRALSQTCRVTRAFSLPLLWSIVDVRTVSELGRIRETFRVSPHLAHYVRSFFWLWDMGGDSHKMDGYSKEEGSLLSMAFRDRVQMYEEQKRANSRPRCGLANRGTAWGEAYFYADDDCRFVKPGWAERPEDCNEAKESKWYDTTYTCHGGGVGPDGKGADKLIKNESELESCMLEVVSQLSSLRRFAWDSPVFSMPIAVGEALEQAESFRALHVRLCLPRQGLHVSEC